MQQIILRLVHDNLISLKLNIQNCHHRIRLCQVCQFAIFDSECNELMYLPIPKTLGTHSDILFHRLIFRKSAISPIPQTKCDAKQCPNKIKVKWTLCDTISNTWYIVGLLSGTYFVHTHMLVSNKMVTAINTRRRRISILLWGSRIQRIHFAKWPS